MNRLENWFCASSLWRFITRKQLLPWLVAGSSLGDHLLEVGAGFGAATAELQRLTQRVTSLEYDPRSVIVCAARQGCPGAGVVRGDAAALPFRDNLFSAVFAVLVLHHLLSPGLQDRAFAEIFRVLRPSGVFLALEVSDGWLQRATHIRSTFVPVNPASAAARLHAAGFSKTTIDSRGSMFRIRSLRAESRDASSTEGSAISPPLV
jgi:ubiquinone/menaquinone biosynthesis C-methylase UbiE